MPDDLSRIPPALAAELRSHSRQIEQAGQLPPEVLAIIHELRWFQFMVPRSCGGLELPLPDTVAIFEELACVDANIGWCVNLGAGANMFAGYFTQEVAARIFSSPAACIAGSGAIGGTALPVEGGHLVSGAWKYASGANHATHFTANAQLLDAAGTRLLDAQGEPLFLSFLFPAADVQNRRNWNATGLRGTSSNDFEVNAAFVPHAHAFSLQKPSAFAQGPLYRFPFASLAVVNMASMLTGIARHFRSAFLELAEAKTSLHDTRRLAQHPKTQAILRERGHIFERERQRMFAHLQEAWALVEQAQPLAPAQQQHLQRSARRAAWAGKALIDALYPLCGMSILDSASRLNRIWRDASTASQHYLLSPLHDAADAQ